MSIFGGWGQFFASGERFTLKRCKNLAEINSEEFCSRNFVLQPEMFMDYILYSSVAAKNSI